MTNCAGLSGFDGQRIGSVAKDRIRPLKVKFDYKSSFDLLAESKDLREDDNYFNVFMAPDRNQKERIEHRKSVEQ